jgi:bidirectional [NiFe] hydrogenase diaphorase subunit
MSPAAAGVVTFVIDGKDVSARADQTVLAVARENGFTIPTLCAIPGISTAGACRLCLVEVAGTAKLQPACVLKAAEGLHVSTRSERLDKYRKMIVELLLSERNHVCSVCVSNGGCELQDLAQTLGVDHVRFPYLYPTQAVDASHRRFTLDHNRCVLCTRCVRICDEVEGAHTWDVMGRGISSLVITDLKQPWGASESCTSCGKCVQVCPTGALSEKGKSVAEMRKRRDFLPYLTLMREEHP